MSQFSKSSKQQNRQPKQHLADAPAPNPAGSENLICSFLGKCHRAYTNASFLNFFQFADEDEAVETRFGPKLHDCPVCGQSISADVQQLAIHVRAHFHERAYECSSSSCQFGGLGVVVCRPHFDWMVANMSHLRKFDAVSPSLSSKKREKNGEEGSKEVPCPQCRVTMHVRNC